MMIINGKIRRWSVRPFRWNKKLASYTVSPSEGIFMIRIKNTVQGKLNFAEQKELYAFHYTNFQNPETMQVWLHKALTDCGFFPIVAIKELSKSIPVRILRNFKFRADQNGNGPRPGVFLEVDMYRRKGCTRSGPCGPGPKEKISFGDDPVDEDLPEDELIDNYLMQTLVDDYRYLGAVVEEPISETEHRGVCLVEPALDIKKSNGGGGGLAAEDDEACAICFDKICDGESGAVATTPCLHNFHWDCLVEWLPRNGACPICRAYCTTIV